MQYSPEIREKRRIQSREWKLKNPERTKELRKKYYYSHHEEQKQKRRDYYRISPEISINGQLLRDYGITLVQYNILFESQNGLCAICNKSDVRRLCVDHNHETGLVRGLLCVGCNTALGSFKDRIDLLESAKKYLKKYATD